MMVLNQSIGAYGDSEATCDGIADVTIPGPRFPQLVTISQPVRSPLRVGTPGLQMTSTHGDTSDTASMPSQDEAALIQEEPALIRDESILIQDNAALMQDLAVAHTADIRRYVLGKSVQLSGMWSLLHYAC